MYTGVVYLLSISLIAYSAVFVVKNFLVCYRASDNGVKNVAVIILVALSLVLALGAAADAWTIDALRDELEHVGNVDQKYINSLERQIKMYTDEAARCIIIAYIVSTVRYFIYRSIKKEISTNCSKDKAHWDWSKINR